MTLLYRAWQVENLITRGITDKAPYLQAKQ